MFCYVTLTLVVADNPLFHRALVSVHGGLIHWLWLLGFSDIYVVKRVMQSITNRQIEGVVIIIKTMMKRVVKIRYKKLVGKNDE
jgi:hypothetical protein